MPQICIQCLLYFDREDMLNEHFCSSKCAKERIGEIEACREDGRIDKETFNTLYKKQLVALIKMLEEEI